MKPGVVLRVAPDRRNHSSREELLRRIRMEFREMPTHRLTCEQVQRLFELRVDICQRVMAALIAEGLLKLDTDQRYVVTENV